MHQIKIWNPDEKHSLFMIMEVDNDSMPVNIVHVLFHVSISPEV